MTMTRRKTPKEKELSGTGRADRASGPSPAFKPGKPTRAPVFLDEDARALWHKLADMLAAGGVMTTGDAVALGLLADALLEYREAKDVMAQHGAIAYGNSGAPYAHPAAVQVRQLRADIRNLLKDFGLTPASRDKVTLPDDQDAETIADILNG